MSRVECTNGVSVNDSLELLRVASASVVYTRQGNDEYLIK